MYEMSTSDGEFELVTRILVTRLREAPMSVNKLGDWEGGSWADWVDGLEKRLEEVAATLREARADLARVQQSPKFSAQGRREELVERGRAWLGKLKSHEEPLTHYNNHLAQLQRQAVKSKPQPSDLVWLLAYFEAAEIRAHLGDMDRLERQALAQSLSRSGENDTWLKALVNSPVPMLPPETLSAA